MKSPFPGMDPWLEGEATFPNFYERFGIFLQDALNEVLPEDYVAITKDRIWVDESRQREPDGSIYGPNSVLPRDEAAGLALMTLSRTGLLAAPVPTSDPHTQSYIEIRTNHGKRLVTAIEILSPSNKRSGDGRAAYLLKHLEYRAASLNVVEIDLLRAGTHTTSFPENRLPPRDSFDYHVCIYIPAEVPQSFFAPIRLREPLPRVIVPLDFDVEPIMVDLQAIFDRCYPGGRYQNLVRYDEPPDPPLSAEQAKWAAEILAAKGVTRA